MNRLIPVRPKQYGLALVAVMWMVAALAILAAGLSTATRSEIRIAQLALAASEAAASGDAAIQLAALELRSVPEQIIGLQERSYRMRDRNIAVRLVPASGLVDLNGAPESLLRDLFVHGAQMDEGAAELLARRIVEWRTPGLTLEDPDYAAAAVPFRPRRGPFEYPEDLLQVLGVSHDDYDKIQRLIAVRGGGSGIDPMAAPVGMLEILTGGDASLAARIAAARDAGDPVTDLTGLVQEHLAGSSALVYRADALVEIDGRHYRRTRWIDLGLPGADGSAWRTIRVEAVIGVEQQTESDNGV